jgi:hypothetical protein
LPDEGFLHDEEVVLLKAGFFEGASLAGGKTSAPAARPIPAA